MGVNLQKKLPRTTICKFWERSDFAKDTQVNRDVKVNKEAKGKDFKEAEDKLNMGTEKRRMVKR